ncbi:MAG: hypothetical protein PHY09_08230 [Desulfuromonadaceae bacterium]|nr:hypothetical protein [Desulfuromonadaceae bacterium]MDD5106310.1 hypothetical protein [Desulfuromonadaceae bacterium]
MKNVTVTILATAVLLFTAVPYGNCAEPPWRTEFDETCAGTSEAMALSQSELQALIGRCERLQKIIEQLDESARKVFLKRLLMCKNLYQYVLDAKSKPPEPLAQ